MLLAKMLRTLLGVGIVVLIGIGCAPAATPTPIPPTATLTPIPPTATATPVPIVTVTSVKGATTRIYATSLWFVWKEGGFMYTVERELGIPLASGLIIPFDKMKRLEVTKEFRPGAVLKARITMLDGKIVEEEIKEFNGDLEAQTELGPFSLAISDVKSVEFQR